MSELPGQSGPALPLLYGSYVPRADSMESANGGALRSHSRPGSLPASRREP